MSRFKPGDRVKINNPSALEPTWRTGTGTIQSVETEDPVDPMLGPLYRLFHDQHRREAWYFESNLSPIDPEGWSDD